MRTSTAFILSALVLVPLGAAEEPLVFDGPAQLLQNVEQTKDARVLEFWASVRVNETRNAYLKVLAVDANPVYHNGTIHGAGWWTEAGVRTDDAWVPSGATNGSSLVELGVVEPGQPATIAIRVHAPAGALLEPTMMQLFYVIAVRSAATAETSGGTLNPSILFQPQVHVEEAPGGIKSGAGTPSLVLGLTILGVAVFVGTAIAVMVVRRRKRDRPPAGGP